MALKNRKANRLKGYDYTREGYYFVTVCVRGHDYCLGEIVNGMVMLNKNGRIVEQCWLDLPNHYANCFLDEYIVMPNHFHGIMIIDNNVVGAGLEPSYVGEGFKPSPTKAFHGISTKASDNKSTKPLHGLCEFVRAFKTFSSRKINERYSYRRFQWQRSFYDHVIRNDEDLDRVREYILYNAIEEE